MTESLKNRAVPLLFIIIFASVSWGGQYLSRDLWEPDEPRYTYVAWEMSRNGNYFMPQRNGEFYAHKPPLMFWLIKAGTMLTGGDFNGMSGRLPTLLGVILALWAFTRLSAMWYDHETAWWSLFILSTSFLFWHKAGTGQIDMLLLGLEMCAVYFLFKSDEHPDAHHGLTAFFFMGLAILAKGPVGLIIPCGIYITGNLLSGRKTFIPKKKWIPGIFVALAFPLAWLLLAKINGAPKAYFMELVFDQNIGRAKGTFGSHYKPFYYYIKYLVMDFMPWSLFIPLSTVILLRQRHLHKQTRCAAGWIFFVVIFFSLCGGKRNLYILSVYPAASLLVASALPFMETVSGRWKNFSVYPLIVFFCLGAMAVFAALFTPFPFSRPIMAGAMMLLLAGAFILGGIHRYIPLTENWFRVFILFLICLEFYTGTFIFPEFNPIKSPAAVAGKIAEVLPENQPILYYGMNGENISIHARRQGKRADKTQNLLSFMKTNPKGILVFSMTEARTLTPLIKPFGTIESFSMGSKKLAWQAYDTGK